MGGDGWRWVGFSGSITVEVDGPEALKNRGRSFESDLLVLMGLLIVVLGLILVVVVLLVSF